MKYSMKKANFVLRFLLICVIGVFFTACGKNRANNNNPTVGAQSVNTYSEQEVDQDLNNFELAIDDLYDAGIDVIFDLNFLIIGFEYYVGDRPTQRAYLESVSASAQTLLAKYSRSYFVRTTSGTTYTAQLQPARVSELQLVIRESARVISELFSGAYKPLPGQAKPKQRLADREFSDWMTGNTSASSLVGLKGKPPKKRNDGGSPQGDDGGGTDPVVGGLTPTSSKAGGIVMAGDGEGTDPTTGGSPRK